MTKSHFMNVYVILTDWVATKQHKFSFHSSGDRKCETRVPAWSGRAPTGRRLLSTHGAAGGRDLSGASLTITSPVLEYSTPVT